MLKALARWPRVRAVLTAATAALACSLATAATLYDAALGSTPAAQGWLSAALPLSGRAVEALADGGYTVDTLRGTAAQFGHALRLPAGSLDGSYTLAFRLRVLEEAHASDNRAGYSVLVVGSDPRRALELSFWSDRVWVQDVDPASPDRLVHGAEALHDTSVLTSYRLFVVGDAFTLMADGRALLDGVLRDYTGEGLPYSVPDLLFFGDNSSRGAAVTLLSSVGLFEGVPFAVHEPATGALWVLAMLAAAGRLPGQRGRRGNRRLGQSCSTGRGWPWASMAT